MSKNSVFAEYATSTAFLIQLSKNQCNYLLRVAAIADLKAPGAMAMAYMDVGPMKSLEARGLVFWNIEDGRPKGFGGLTKAGDLMVELLREAGLTIENTNTVSMLKKLDRRAA